MKHYKYGPTRFEVVNLSEVRLHMYLSHRRAPMPSRPHVQQASTAMLSAYVFVSHHPNTSVIVYANNDNNGILIDRLGFPIILCPRYLLVYSVFLQMFHQTSLIIGMP